MTPIIYYYKFRYYRMATRPAAYGRQRVVFEEREESQRYWQPSSEERYVQARYYGRRVRKAARIERTTIADKDKI